MNKYQRAIYRDMERLADDARALMDATADVAGEKVETVRKRLILALGSAKSMLNRAEDEAIGDARAAVNCVLDNPRQALAVAVAAGAVIGCIVAFAWPRKCD